MDISSAPTVIDRAPTYNVKRRHAGLVTIVEKEREWRAIERAPHQARRFAHQLRPDPLHPRDGCAPAESGEGSFLHIEPAHGVGELLHHPCRR
jgi:hypothetical protein